MVQDCLNHSVFVFRVFLRLGFHSQVFWALDFVHFGCVDYGFVALCSMCGKDILKPFLVEVVVFFKGGF